MSEVTKDLTGRDSTGRIYVNPDDVYVRSDAPETHIADPSAGVTVDTQARDAIVSILNVLEAHGLMSSA